MRALLLGLLLLAWSSPAIGQTLYTFNGGGTSGSWTDPATWTTDPTGSTSVAPRVPTTNDNVVVTNSFVVQLNTNVPTSGLSVTVQRGGVLDLTSAASGFSAGLARLAGQGTLRIGRPYFPAVATGANDFDDANTGTVEFYNWPAGTTTLPQPESKQYNNLRLLNTTATAYVAQLDNDLTLAGSLTLTRTNTTATGPLLTFNLGGTASSNRTLTILGGVTVGVGTYLGVSNVAGAHALNVGGSFVNNGTVRLHNGTAPTNPTGNDTQAALLTFTGTSDTNFACNGPTDLGRLQVNKGIDGQVLLNVTSAVNSANARGNLRLNYYGDGRLLVLINGLVKLGNNVYLEKIHNGSVAGPGAGTGYYELGSSTTSPTLWLAGGTVINNNALAFVIYGMLRVSGGNLQSVTSDAMVIREDGQILIEGGTTTVDKFRPSSTSSAHRGSFVMTGGVFEAVGTFPNSVNTNFARFAIPYTTQSFRMTGGTIRVSNPAPSNGGLFHIGINSNNAIVSGGTIEVNLPNSNTNGAVLSTAPLWNLTVKKPALTSGTTSKALLADIPSEYTSGATNTAQPLTVFNNFTIDGTNPTTFDASGQNVTIQGTLTVAAGSTYLTGNNTTTFSGGQNQLLTNNGTIGATAAAIAANTNAGLNVGTFNNWTIDKSAGTLTLAGANSTFATMGVMSLLNGVLSDNGKTVNVYGNLVNSATHTSGGGSGSITLAGAGGQLVSGNDMGVFGNLSISSTAASGAVAATLTANMSVANTLNFASNNLLAIGANRLALTNVNPARAITADNDFSNLCFVQTSGNQSDLGLQKTYGGADNFVFPVGTGTKYAPATIQLGLATSLARYGQVSVSPVSQKNPFVTDPNALKYYWKVRSVGFGAIPSGAINMVFRMTSADVTTAGTQPAYIPARYLPVAWTAYNDVNLVGNGSPNASINFNALGQFEGEFTAGVPAAFGAVTAYYSRNNGPWATPATWSTVDYNGAAASAAPAANNPVFIGSASARIYHTVTVAANGANSGSLVIDRGSVMDVGTTTGHNFGALPDAKIGGSGLLRVSTAATDGTVTFPGGDFGSFLQENGGTVEYYTGTQDFTLPTASGTLALNSYKNLWLNAGTGRTITLPSLDLRVYAQLKTGTSGGVGLVQISNAASGNLRADSLLAVQAGSLRYRNAVARSLTADTDVRIDAGATFDVATSTATTVANALTVGRSLTNNGTLNFKVGTGAVTLTFTSSQPANFTGTNTSAATTLYTLLLNKGVGQAATLNLNVAGTLTTPASGWLTLTNGTLRYAKTTGVLGIHNADSPYLIPGNAALTVDAVGATVTVATSLTAPGTNLSSASDLKLAGQLQVLQGTLNVGTVPTGTTTATGVVGNDLEYASAGTPTIRVGAGGTLYVNGQLRRTTANTNGSLRYDQTGGTVEIRGARAEVYQNNERGLFEVQGPGSIFRMSGGTLALRGSNTRPTIIADLYLRPDSTVVTAGTVVLGNTAATKTTVSVESLVPLYDMKVENGPDANSTNTGLLTGLNPLSLQGSLTISNNFAYFNANGLGLSIDQHLYNNNASTNTGLANGGFQPGTASQTTTFTGKGPAVQQITSTTTGNLTVFGGLVVNNAQAGGTLQLGRNVRTIGTLTIAKGTLADNGQTLTALGDVVNSATHTSAPGGSLTLAGTVNQNIDGNGQGRFGNLVLNNTAATNAGATTLANHEITGVLTLSSGVLTIGSNLLWVSNPAPTAIVGSFSSTRFIRTNGIVADLGLRKSYPAGAADFTFPVGAASKYTPVRMNVTSNAAVGTLTVRPIDLAHPSTTDPAAKELTYYWKVSSTGFSAPAVDHTFTYVDNGVGNDVNGTEANYKLGRFYNGAWTPQNGVAASMVDATANTLANPSATYFDGDYTGGEQSEFGPVPTFYSRNLTAGQSSGANWDDPSAWTYNADGSDSAPLPTVQPTLANPVVVRSGHTIATNGPGRGAATLLLQGLLDLGPNAANNFNTVTGTGVLRIGSALFPAGNYLAFLLSGGGTVDYSGAVQLPARDTYNNLIFSGGNAKQLSNLDLTINGTLQVAPNTTVDNPTSQSITLTSATDGATLAGTFNLNDGTLTTGAFLTTTPTGTLTLGAGLASIGTMLTNGGTLRNGRGDVAVGTALLNTGTYTANAGTGNLTVGTNFTNNGTYSAGVGRLNVGGNFSNAAGKTFTAATGNVLAMGSFSNAGTYNYADGTANTLRVAGDFSNLAGGSFAASASSLVLNGNFTNNGSFDPGTSVTQFILDATRTLTGATTFYDLQKAGTGSLALGPNTNVTVADLLTMRAGLIATGTSNVLALSNSAIQPIVGASTNSYVAGRLLMNLPNAAASIRVFPVGLGGRYRPVTVQPQGTSSNAQVLVEIINGAPKGLLDATLSNISANRYYRVQLQSGSIAQPTVQLSYNTDVVDEEVNVPGNLRVATSSGANGPWSTTGGSGVFSPAFPRGYTTSAAAQTVVDANSFFALASTNKVDNPLTGQAPLPVELLQFTAVRQGSAVRAAWATASEKSSAYFVVQRSADGRTFADVQRVQAQGNSVVRHDYAALDVAPLAGLSYYRLRQVDQDGQETYSSLATVRFDGGATAPSLVAYPNPAPAQGFQLLATSLGSAGGTVQVHDNVGHLVLSQTVAPGTTEASIRPARPLASGMYFATWQAADGSKLTTKVAIE